MWLSKVLLFSKSYIVSMSFTGMHCVLKKTFLFFSLHLSLQLDFAVMYLQLPQYNVNLCSPPESHFPRGTSCWHINSFQTKVRPNPLLQTSSVMNQCYAPLSPLSQDGKVWIRQVSVLESQSDGPHKAHVVIFHEVTTWLTRRQCGYLVYKATVKENGSWLSCSVAPLPISWVVSLSNIVRRQ